LPAFAKIAMADEEEFLEFTEWHGSTPIVGAMFVVKHNPRYTRPVGPHQFALGLLSYNFHTLCFLFMDILNGYCIIQYHFFK